MKFRLKIMFCMLGLLALLFGIGGSLLITLSFRDALEREQMSAYNTYQMVQGTLQVVNSMNRGFDLSDIEDIMGQLSKQNSGAWTAIRLYTDTETIYEDGRFPLTESLLPAVSGYCRIQYAQAGNDSHFLAVCGLLEAGESLFYLDIVCDITHLFEMRNIQRRVYQGVFLFMAGLCVLFSYILSYTLTRPLSELSRASKAISEGQLSKRAKLMSEDEIGDVVRDFNAMADSLDHSISELKDALERQERFVGSFAHEMKTPMTSIIGYGDLIRGRTLSSEEQYEAANYIVTEGRRLEHLSQKLLELLVVKRGDILLLLECPAALIRGLVAHLEPVYQEQGIEFCCELEDGVCLLEPDLVKTLLVNLWDNARKAMEGQKGCIRIHLTMIPEGCRIVVSDNGRGIPPDALKYLTEAFYRVDKSRSRRQGGVGLGLALCQEIVALHNGAISFDSRPGEGTSVTIELKAKSEI
ncbi:MAG: HAMP domain-containing histidine kinase [Lachnospiraceae bacterium]|nr:HAMP domain-containing histidine kinase [Lachnospiraceae bacterium]